MPIASDPAGPGDDQADQSKRWVLEIGPGEGALTKHLLAAGARVTAVEVDPALTAYLRERFAGEPALEIIESDILEVDLPSLIAERTADLALVAGNLPYYITSPILRKLFTAAGRIEQAVFLMQKEVAERVTAKKGSRDYGYLTVLCRLCSEPKYLFSVPARAFRPPPKVTSAVVSLAVRPEQPENAAFLDFAKACFTQPRKKLVNNLSGLYDRAELAGHEQSQLRAQQLDVEELQSFWRQLERASG